MYFVPPLPRSTPASTPVPASTPAPASGEVSFFTSSAWASSILARSTILARSSGTFTSVEEATSSAVSGPKNVESLAAKPSAVSLAFKTSAVGLSGAIESDDPGVSWVTSAASEGSGPIYTETLSPHPVTAKPRPSAGASMPCIRRFKKPSIRCRISDSRMVDSDLAWNSTPGTGNMKATRITLPHSRPPA